MDNSIKKMAMLPMRGNCMVPGRITNFDVIREGSVQALEKAMCDDEMIFIASQKDPVLEEPTFEDMYRIGTTVKIKQIVKMPKGLVRVMGEGMERARLISMGRDEEGYHCEIIMDPIDNRVSDLEQEAYLQVHREVMLSYLESAEGFTKENAANLMDLESLEDLTNQLTATLNLPFEKRQKILEAETLMEEAEVLCRIMQDETDIAAIRNRIGEKLHERLDENQKEYVLREQLRLIREELGDDHTDSDADRFMEAAEALEASDEIKDKIKEQIRRFREIPTQSPDSTVLYGYIDTLLKMPWDKRSEDSTDLARARQILDRDHYGLEKVKERIIEFLAVRMLTNQGTSPILCLVGPPGTGKTSICRSVAEALDRKYVRMSLGGVHDEAEIRGHRRTYVGAMPGRIASALKKAGVKNPLIVLDEIDKLSANHRGETASAMLEVLDAEQNEHFEDHYIELPIDLSEVMFITTANDAQAIPQPLYDRMEVIEINSYTENEKMHIAKDHLLPKQIKANGLMKKQLSVSDKAIADIIARYTREAGVRSLERAMGDICRKAVCRVLQDGQK
ncbi:MAG: AAA family ATPase, partial [Lachnospiraceae bacterium]|nr:AAA family ATPase [Candidatus Equihabitans merdae]